MRELWTRIPHDASPSWAAMSLLAWRRCRVAGLREIVAAIGDERTIFSLDLRDGEPLRRWSDERSPKRSEATPIGNAMSPSLTLQAPPASSPIDRRVVAMSGSARLDLTCGIRPRLDVSFDLGPTSASRRVGQGRMISAEEIASTYPHVELFAGGGIVGQRRFAKA